MTYSEKNGLKHFLPMFSMLKAIGEISKVADFTTPCVNITNSAFSQLSLACTEMTINNKIRTPQVVLIVGLSWASNDITFGLKKLHLAVRALP